jgi:hypothetical protein
VVDRNSLPRDIKAARSLRDDLDEAAIDAVKKWKLIPGSKDGTSVATMVNVEPTFHLY